MIVGVPAIIERCLPDIADDGVNLTHNLRLVAGLRLVSGAMFDQPASRTQIRQGMQIRGMVLGRRRDYAAGQKHQTGEYHWRDL